MRLRITGAIAGSICAGVFLLATGQARAGDEEWPGTMKRPAKGIKKIVFVVDASGSEPVIKGLKYRGELFEFSQVEWQDDQLTFSWKPGEDLSCELVRGEAGIFTGGCPIPDSETSVEMTLKPSADEEKDGAAVEVAGESDQPTEGEPPVKVGESEKSREDAKPANAKESD